MRNVEAKPIKFTDLSDDSNTKSDAMGEVKGGAPAANQKGGMFFDEADALFGRDSAKKQTP